MEVILVVVFLACLIGAICVVFLLNEVDHEATSRNVEEAQKQGDRFVQMKKQHDETADQIASPAYSMFSSNIYHPEEED